MARVLVDITPLRESAPFRRLWWGRGLAVVGGQLTVMAVALEIYDLTRSTFMVGLLGVFALVPLVIMGLYGGSLVDHHDRRTVALISGLVMWGATIGLAIEAWLHMENIWILYVMVFIQSGAGAVNAPARGAIIPRLVSRELLPAANALNASVWTIALMVGPLIGSVLVAAFGYKIAYTVDVITFTASLYAVLRLPSVRPLRTEEEETSPVRGWRSVIDGFAFLSTRPNIRMTFFMDIAAMVLAQPVALFPAVASDMIGGGATTAGWLAAFVAFGSVVALIFSGPLGRIRRQGLAVAVMVAGWGLGILGFGVVLIMVGTTHPDTVILWALIAAGVCLAFAGACDAVSSVYRNVILQSATPDKLQGRLQGIFTVTVAGGPNLGRLASGTLAKGLGGISAVPLGLTALIGGGLCILAVGALTRVTPKFLKYDSHHPQP
ncbi:MAG: MFS transporter [Propionibacteriaceae bacterium]|nr:MFS transporter [Propionibacteriaceae bacterium]